jgi:methionyl-tRNA synthetase
MSKHTITAALPYANGPVHIGHLAGVYLPADTYARFMRLKGEEILFVCGSDEHGVPITLRAQKEGVTPQDVVDRYHAIIQDSFRELGISFDVYSRTSNAIHHQTAQEFFHNLLQKGAFKELISEHYFDEEAQQFLADRYITGDCPKCHQPGAYGDQCEKCGSTLSPNELVNPKSALSGSIPVLKSTKNWYLPLDELQTNFLDHYIHANTHWRNTVLGQCKSWLNDGLKERAMTRDLNWGIPVPVPNAEGKVLYVWFEAPIGYISATKEARPQDWESWWTGDTELVHFIGKDNIVFHCIIFPAMLHLRGDGYIVPKQVPANEFLNLEGQKISTSRNWAVWLNEYLEELPNKQDELRFVLHSIAPETKDSEFTWKDYQTRVNSELVGILGNFANRVLVLIQKYLDGTVKPSEHGYPNDTLSTTFLQPIQEKLQQFKFREAMGTFMEIARYGNKFLADNEPWKIIKTDPQQAEKILTFSYEILCNICLASEVFLPNTYQNLQLQLGISFSEDEKRRFWQDKHWYTPNQSHHIGNLSLLFQKIEDETIQLQIEKLHQSQHGQTATPAATESQTAVMEAKASIEYEDFAKLDLRVAEVLLCEKVEKADKLLKLTLKVGDETCTVLSGIAQHFKPEEVVGKQVLYLYNLKPRKMRGIESQGMILMAEDSDGKLHFMQPDQNITPGSGVS